MAAGKRGYLPPEEAAALREQLARTQADLDALRNTNQAWGAEVDKVIAAFNASDPDSARDAFARIDALIDARRQDRAAEQRADDLAQARSKHAQATLLYPHRVSARLPLLRQAAELAGDDVWCWIDYAHACRAAGHLADAAEVLTRCLTHASGRDRAAVFDLLGDVQATLGDRPAALTSFGEALRIAHDLVARDPGNAEWRVTSS
jgi:tetratricopeptide (TPR) repeat protein